MSREPRTFGVDPQPDSSIGAANNKKELCDGSGSTRLRVIASRYGDANSDARMYFLTDKSRAAEQQQESENKATMRY
jgi:hypothetical protein